MPENTFYPKGWYWSQQQLVHSACYLALTVGVVGCYRKPTYTPPDTYPVTGRVVSTKGNLPVNATIQFTPENPNLRAQGVIQNDGTFTLRTLFHEEWLPGATAGDHRVAILLPLGMERRAGGGTITVDEAYTVEAKENDFTITLR